MSKNIPDWVRQQRKICSKVQPGNQYHYFTVEMLSVPFRVTKSVKGLDPDKPKGRQIRRWFSRHKGVGKRKLSDAVREQKQKLVEKARQARRLKG